VVVYVWGEPRRTLASRRHQGDNCAKGVRRPNTHQKLQYRHRSSGLAVLPPRGRHTQELVSPEHALYGAQAVADVPLVGDDVLCGRGGSYDTARSRAKGLDPEACMHVQRTANLQGVRGPGGRGGGPPCLPAAELARPP